MMQRLTTDRGRNYVRSMADGTTLSLPSVTTILSTVLAKPALPRWAAKECGSYAADNIHVLAQIEAHEGPQAVAKMVANAPWATRDAAAAKGSLVHELIEAMTLDQAPTVPVEVSGYVRAWEQWLTDFGPHPIVAEAMVAGDGYAGTLDQICEIGSERWLIDYKTGKGIYPEVSLQLTAYAGAEHIVVGGELHEMYPIDRLGVLHLQDGKYEFREVDRCPGMWSRVLDLYSWITDESPIGAPLTIETGRLF